MVAVNTIEETIARKVLKNHRKTNDIYESEVKDLVQFGLKLSCILGLPFVYAVQIGVKYLSKEVKILGKFTVYHAEECQQYFACTTKVEPDKKVYLSSDGYVRDCCIVNELRVGWFNNLEEVEKAYKKFLKIEKKGKVV